MVGDGEREERRVGARPAIAHEEPPPSASSVDLRPKGSRLWMALIIVGALAAALAAALFAFKGKKTSEENARKAGAAAGDGTEPADGTMGMEEAQAVIIEGLKEDLAKKPCDRGIALRLATELTELDRFGEVGEISARFAKACPEPFPRLLRKAFYAHEQLEQWPQAEAVATALLLGEPEEGSFWWWRGQARAKQQKLPAAAADLRQAMAATPFADSRGYSLMDFIDIADKVEAACDAAAGIRLYESANERGINDRVRDRMTKLHLAGNCDAVYGAGQAVIAIDPAQPVPTVQVTIGRTSGKFLIAPRTGFTVLARAFAGKAEITPAGEPVESYAAGSVYSGPAGVVAKMSVAGASAPDVHVLVADQLPGGIDGILGMSFLMRFDYQELDDQITLDAWTGG